MVHGRVADQHKSHLSQVMIDAEAIELEDLAWRTLETRLIVQQCVQQHILLNYVCTQTKTDKTVEFLLKKPRIAENMVGTKNTYNC